MKSPHLYMRVMILLCVVISARTFFCQPTSQNAITQARALADAGKYSEAETVLRGAIQTDPSAADAHFLLGYVYFREQKPRESLAEFTVGARFRRPAADDFRVIASDYVLLGDYPDAEKWLSEVTSEKPDNPVDWYLLGRTQYNENHFEAAISSFERALALRPHYIEAENNLGLAWQGLNNSDRAMAAFRSAIDWQREDPKDAQPYLNMGGALVDQNHADEALPYLKVAAKLAPKNPKIHEELARAYEAESKLTQAQHELEVATSLAPNVSGLHFKLGRIYSREGLRDRAQQQFGICAKLDGTHSSTNTPNPYISK